VSEQVENPVEKERRPRKRRKLENRDEDEEMLEPTVDEDEAPSVVRKERSSTPPNALPMFPLPVLPNAPSKTDLALQGLDKAYMDAEIVDSIASLSLHSEGEEHDGTGLSEKARKRLKELGITELFAGEWILSVCVWIRDIFYSISPNCIASISSSSKSVKAGLVSSVRPSKGRLCISSHWKWEDICLCLTNS
jgi:hypothetical protein